MTVDPLYIFVFAGLFSPGPNIILLLASGARFGARATWAHILGIAAGVGIIGALVGYGVGAILLAKPEITLLLKLIAALWIIYMAWRLWTKSGRSDKAATDKPFTFVQAVLFQWVNPKIWAVAIAASAGYAIGLPPEKEALRLALAFSGINLFVCTFWTYTGQAIARYLRTDGAWRLFHKVMSILLALSVWMIFK